jgi:endonuclease YncB( thermonuclease family)
MRFAPFLAVALAALAAPASADVILDGIVTHVRDADTIEVEGVAVRLKGVNAPERGTALGDEASAAVRHVLMDTYVVCRLTGETTYDREVGWCSGASIGDLGAWLMAHGLAGRCAAYDEAGDYLGLDATYRGPVPSYCNS